MEQQTEDRIKEGRSDARGPCDIKDLLEPRKVFGSFGARAQHVMNKQADSRIRGFHLTVGSGIISFSDPMALEGNFSLILTEDWR